MLTFVPVCALGYMCCLVSLVNGKENVSIGRLDGDAPM